MSNDGKWRVSVEGQIDAPFDSYESALEYAVAMDAEGFGCSVYLCKEAKPTLDKEAIAKAIHRAHIECAESELGYFDPYLAAKYVMEVIEDEQR